MKRDLFQKLLNWKADASRKVLMVRGARQTGKTFLIKHFGQEQFPRYHYFNFESDPQLAHFFSTNLDPERIIKELSLYQGEPIDPRRDLVFFDEIQASPQALNALKYFQEKGTVAYLIAAGSLLGIKLSRPGSFPVGKVRILDLYPMSFLEFLEGIGKKTFREFLEKLKTSEPISQPLHEELLTLLRQYFYVGGMPEAVDHFSQTSDYSKVRRIQDDILNSYALDFAKHASATNTAKLTHIWDSIPSHLARENKKFIFSQVRKGGRSREYEDSIIWLEDAGLIHRAFMVSESRFPLRHHEDRKSFKVYLLDIGLLGAMNKIPVEWLVTGNRIFSQFRGALVENFAAQQMVKSGQTPLHYWKRENTPTEVDFLWERGDHVYPLEVKSGINPKSKSLRFYGTEFHPPCLLRSTPLNLKQDGKILNIPLYALELLESFL